MTDRARQTDTRIIDVDARCQVCQWSNQGAGALGRAALHHDRTGHETQTTQTLLVIYGEQPAPEDLGQLTIGDTA